MDDQFSDPLEARVMADYGKYIGMPDPQETAFNALRAKYASGGEVDTSDQSDAPQIDENARLLSRYQTPYDDISRLLNQAPEPETPASSWGADDYSGYEAPSNNRSTASNYNDLIMKALQQQQAELKNNYESLQGPGATGKSMSEAEKNFRIAAALVAPTKTGRFGEQLGPVATALGGIEESKRQDAQAKMALELQRMQARSTNIGQQVTNARQLYGSSMMNQTGNNNASSIISLYPNDMQNAYYAADPKDQPKLLMEMTNGLPAPIKNSIFGQTYGAVTPKQGVDIVKEGVTPKPEIINTLVGNKTLPLNKDEYSDYVQKGVVPARFVSGESSLEGAKATEIAATENAKSGAKGGRTLLESIPTNENIIQSTQTINNILGKKENQIIVGQMAGNGVWNAMLQAAKQGIHTPIGAVSHDAEKSLAAMNLSEDQLSTLRTLAYHQTNIQKEYLKLFPSRVTDKDLAFTLKLVPDTADDAKSTLIKANTIQIAHEGQLALAQGYQAYLRTHPNAPDTEYLDTNAAKSIIKGAKDKYTEFSKNTGMTKQNTSLKENNVLDNLTNIYKNLGGQ